MNKYLKHRFGFYSSMKKGFFELNNNHPLMNDDYCEICNKEAKELHRFSKDLYFNHMDKINIEIEMNKNYPCLTEEEYTIKKLLE